MDNGNLKVIYHGDDVSRDVLSVEVVPDIELITGSKAKITLPVRDVILTLVDGGVIHTNTKDCQVLATERVN